jgi:uncharacterized protein YgbK (DUF1537 family)
MTARFGAIADEFTCATDFARLLERSGVRVSRGLSVPPETADLKVIAL